MSVYVFVCWFPPIEHRLLPCNTVFPFSSLIQTSRRSSHRCERSTIREQHYALERCYFWVSHALNSTPPCLPSLLLHRWLPCPTRSHPPCQSGFNISDCGSGLAGNRDTQIETWGSLSGQELVDWIRLWSKKKKNYLQNKINSTQPAY